MTPLSIVVCAPRRDPLELGAFLASIRRQNIRPIEVIVVVRSSQEQEMARVIFGSGAALVPIPDDEYTLPYALDLGVIRSSCWFTAVVLDPATVSDANWTSRLSELADERTFRLAFPGGEPSAVLVRRPFAAEARWREDETFAQWSARVANEPGCGPVIYDDRAATHLLARSAA